MNSKFYSSTARHNSELTNVKRLLSYTDQVTAHPAVNDPLLGDDVEVPVHLEYSDPRGDHDGLLTRPVQVPVDEMFLEGVEGNVENLQEVSLRGSGESGPWRPELSSAPTCKKTALGRYSRRGNRLRDRQRSASC